MFDRATGLEEGEAKMASSQSTTVLGIVIPSIDHLFLGVVALHVLAGLASVIFGIAAMLVTKERGRHSAMGILYFWCLCGVFLTATILASMRWAEDYVLFLLGTLAFSLVALGRLAVVQAWGLRFHMVFMGASYIVLVTAFYVDNGKILPIWRNFPAIAYWMVPALIGIPLILRALARHPLLRSYNETRDG
jgi:hypothetical protein